MGSVNIAGLLVMVGIAIPVGILSALYKNTFLNHFSRIFALLGVSLPSFWLGLMLIYFFAVHLSFFPVMGRGKPEHLVLPALTLGLGMSAQYARLLRASMLEVLGQDVLFILAVSEKRMFVGRFHPGREIWEMDEEPGRNLNVTTRLREYAELYLKVGGTEKKKIAAWATLVGKLHHEFR